MLDYYIVAGKPKEHRIFWADEGLQVIATSSIKGADPTNIMDLAQGNIRSYYHFHFSMEIIIFL